MVVVQGGVTYRTTVGDLIALAGGAYTDEQARDVVAAMFAAGTHSGVAFTYNDAGDSISATATPPSASIQSLTSASTITPVATNDLVSVSALAVNATIANPTGTAAAGQGFVITIKDNGTARTLTWGTDYVGMDGAPVATTTAGKLVDIPVRYSAILSKWLVYKPSVQA